MKLEELFEDGENLVDSNGNLVSVERIEEPKIVLYGDKTFELQAICRKAPWDADAFLKGENESVRKRRENDINYWPPVVIFDTLNFQSVQYFKKLTK